MSLTLNLPSWNNYISPNVPKSNGPISPVYDFISLGCVACALIDATVKFDDVGDLHNTNLARLGYDSS